MERYNENNTLTYEYVPVEQIWVLYNGNLLAEIIDLKGNCKYTANGSTKEQNRDCRERDSR
jgi:hypothetical protein